MVIFALFSAGIGTIFAVAMAMRSVHRQEARDLAWIRYEYPEDAPTLRLACKRHGCDCKGARNRF